LRVEDRLTRKERIRRSSEIGPRIGDFDPRDPVRCELIVAANLAASEPTGDVRSGCGALLKESEVRQIFLTPAAADMAADIATGPGVA